MDDVAKRKGLLWLVLIGVMSFLSLLAFGEYFPSWASLLCLGTFLCGYGAWEYRILLGYPTEQRKPKRHRLYINFSIVCLAVLIVVLILSRYGAD